MIRLVVAAAALALAACGTDPVAENKAATAALPDVETQPPDEMSGSGDAEGNAASPAAPAAAAAEIPQALRGRWALSPTDCAGGSTGLLEVTADELRFHNSRAATAGNVDRSADFISADFAFSAPGKRWTQFQSLQLKGDQLIRTESGPVASYTYARCR